MNLGCIINNFTTVAFRILRLTDWAEIVLLSIGIYYISLWLKKDRNIPLLTYFYGYLGLFFCTYTFNLSVISTLLFLFSPALIMIFCMVHQNTLARNFITLQNVIPTRACASNWAELLVRTCLIAMNNNKAVSCIIERSDSLAHHVTSQCLIHTEFDKPLLDLLIDSPGFEESKYVWFSKQGKILGINTEWDFEQHETWLVDSVKHIAPRKQSALYITHHTDALVMHIIPETRTFTLIVEGQTIEPIDAHRLIAILQNYLEQPIQNKKGVYHAGIIKKAPSQQREH